MLDSIILVTVIIFLVIQLIVSCQLTWLVAKSKKEGGVVVSNFLLESIPYILLIYTVIMMMCAIKTDDTLPVMLPIVLSMCFLFDMHIFYVDGEKVNHYYFLLQKNVCNSIDINGKLVIVEFENKKTIVRLSHKKIEMLRAYLK